MNNIYSLYHLNNDVLVEGLKRAVAKSNEQTAVLLAHIAEVDRRKLYAEKAQPSMFQYAVSVLGLSEAAAYMRITAARAARDYPVIFEKVASGALHLTAIRHVASYLTGDNHRELLEAVSHKSKRAVLEELARRFPQPDAPQAIRKLPVPKAKATSAGESTALSSAESSAEPSGDEGAGSDAQWEKGTGTFSMPRVAVHMGPSARTKRSQSPFPTATPTARPAEDAQGAAQPAPRDAIARAQRPAGHVTPLSERRYKVQLTVSQSLRDKLRAAQDLLRHQVPDGDLEQVLDHALDALLEKRMKQKYAVTDRPLSKRGDSADEAAPRPDKEPGPESTSERERAQQRSRAIPNAVKREVLARDGQRCAYVDAEGNRCPQTGALEFHHVVPFAKGGEHRADNVRLFCKAHNTQAAEQDYGVAWMDAQRQAKNSPGEVRAPRVRYRLRPPAAHPAPASSARNESRSSYPSAESAVATQDGHPRHHLRNFIGASEAISDLTSGT